MSLISLTRDKFAIVDRDCFGFLNQFRWFATKSANSFYAVRNTSMKYGKRHMTYMHHWIVGFPLGDKVVDHIDGDTLNNQRTNLRIVSRRENQGNRKEFREETKTSRFVGVRWDKNAEKWRAQIIIKGKQHHLGLFVDEEAADIAYRAKLESLNA